MCAVARLAAAAATAALAAAAAAGGEGAAAAAAAAVAASKKAAALQVLAVEEPRPCAYVVLVHVPGLCALSQFNQQQRSPPSQQWAPTLRQEGTAAAQHGVRVVSSGAAAGEVDDAAQSMALEQVHRMQARAPATPATFPHLVPALALL